MAMAMATLDAAQGLVGNLMSLPPRPSSWRRRLFCWWVFRILVFRGCSCWASSPGELVACSTIVAFLYFLIVNGTAATEVYKVKKAEGTAETRGGQRGPAV